MPAIDARHTLRLDSDTSNKDEKKKKFKAHKERVATIEENTQDLWRALEKYLTIQKELLAAETVLHQSLTKFYTQNELILGSNNHLALEFIRAKGDEQLTLSTILDTISASVTKVQEDYHDTIQGFKSRLTTNVIDHSVIRDFSVWEESHQETFDPVLLLLVRLNECRAPFSLNEWFLSGGLISEINFSTNILSKPGIDEVLHNGHGVNYFRTFLKTEFSVENLNFYLAVERYRAITDESTRKTKAEEIFNSYIKPNAPQELNIDQSILEDIRKKMDHPTVQLFDPVQSAIHVLMRDDSFPRFLKSGIFHRLQNRVTNISLSPPTQRSPSLISRATPEVESNTKSLYALTHNEWKMLSDCSESHYLSQGETIKRKNTRCLYHLKQGKVTLAGLSQTIHIEQGDFFGEADFLNLGFSNRLIYTISGARTQIVRLEEEGLIRVLCRDHRFGEKFYKMMCNQLSHHLYRLPIRDAVKRFDYTNNGSFSGEEEPPELVKMRKKLSIAEDVPFLKKLECSITKTVRVEGNLYIFEKMLLFYSKYFGVTHKIPIQMEEIHTVTTKDRNITFHTEKQKHTFNFPAEMHSEAYNYINTLWKKWYAQQQQTLRSAGLKRANTMSPSKRRERVNSAQAADLQEIIRDTEEVRSSTDDSSHESMWSQILQLATLNTYKRGDIIARREDMSPKLYQVLEGVVRYNNPDKAPSIPTEIYRAGDIFGDINFWFGGGAPADIVVDNDMSAKVYCFEKSSLENLFKQNGQTAQKFFHYLSRSICRKLMSDRGTIRSLTPDPTLNGEELVTPRGKKKHSFVGTISRASSVAQNKKIAAQSSQDNAAHSEYPLDMMKEDAFGLTKSLGEARVAEEMAGDREGKGRVGQLREERERSMSFPELQLPRNLEI
ncbi:regulator of G-protein signaling 21 [Planoprotostelium fungivorum]|uniref:Regulator of G-protein signaling 21 n=1 Tax=Planoprotostelium fungivorum TaxID=1890364 RepID=A0A2P6MVJ3_9EUKA|nr:regulator of G-protein signaling 21 [Planoprotostelium fungivorum]